MTTYDYCAPHWLLHQILRFVLSAKCWWENNHQQQDCYMMDRNGFDMIWFWISLWMVESILFSQRIAEWAPWGCLGKQLHLMSTRIILSDWPRLNWSLLKQWPGLLRHVLQTSIIRRKSVIWDSLTQIPVCKGSNMLKRFKDPNRTFYIANTSDPLSSIRCEVVGRQDGKEQKQFMCWETKSGCDPGVGKSTSERLETWHRSRFQQADGY